jgi:hypothetical protein
MLRRMRVAFKFMTYGILIGVFLAPRSGAETRKQISTWVGSMTHGMVGSSRGATL